MVFIIYFVARVVWQNLPHLPSVGGRFPGEKSPAPGLLIYLVIMSTGYFFALVIWYWSLAKLFGLYAQGRIFDSEAIRWIRRAGICCVLGWLFNPAQAFIFSQNFYKPQSVPVVPGMTVVSVHNYRMGFFDFDFGFGIDFGLLVGGAIVMLIAWIMDEGRKLQEEQALTV